MTAQWVATWSGHLRHHPKPDDPDRTLCGRRAYPPPGRWSPRPPIHTWPDCRRCTKGDQ